MEDKQVFKIQTNGNLGDIVLAILDRVIAFDTEVSS